MLFNSFVFFAFFAVVFLMYAAMARRVRAQNLLLCLASYFFYGCWDWRFLGLILLSTAVDFVCGLRLDDDGSRIGGEKRRRRWLAVSVVTNLGILGFFKYYDFFAAEFGALMHDIGVPIEPRLLDIVLPVGISFYTFQTMSYTIDVYRGTIRAERDVLNFALFVAFFPQLVAGPILRASEMLPQIREPRRMSMERMGDGAYLMLWGLFKKVVIADNLAPLVDRVFAADSWANGGMVLVGVYAFAVQIYCDFSGYTDIARGVSRMLGFDLPLNFRLPFFARNPSDFWQRWHISLSSWLRDYVYIPLGGNRRGARRTQINLMLTMLLGGLWHGAAWTFVLWGAYQGALLVVHKQLQPMLAHFTRGFAGIAGRALHLVCIVASFHLCCVGWLIFRAESVAQIPAMLWAVVRSPAIFGTGATTLAVVGAPLALMQLVQYVRRDLDCVFRAPAFARGVVYVAMFYGLIVWGVETDVPFIYFQF